MLASLLAVKVNFDFLKANLLATFGNISFSLLAIEHEFIESTIKKKVLHGAASVQKEKKVRSTI